MLQCTLDKGQFAFKCLVLPHDIASVVTDLCVLLLGLSHSCDCVVYAGANLSRLFIMKEDVFLEILQFAVTPGYVGLLTVKSHLIVSQRKLFLLSELSHSLFKCLHLEEKRVVVTLGLL